MKYLKLNSDLSNLKNLAKKVALYLKKEKVGAIPTETFYGLAADPFSEKALKKLKDANEFPQYASKVDQKISENELEKRFNQCLETMTGGQDTISFGKGLWLNMIQGKKVLSQVINSGCFCVKATDDAILAGKEKINAVIKDLLKKKDCIPDDFKELKKLIDKRLKE